MVQERTMNPYSTDLRKRVVQAYENRGRVAGCISGCPTSVAREQKSRACMAVSP
jgi:hypothetical protein